MTSLCLAAERTPRVTHALLMVVVVLVQCVPAAGQIGPAYSWANLAGMPGGLGNVDGTGSVARFGSLYGVAVDSAGNVYVADAFHNHTIRKITPAGEVTTLAGLAGYSGSEDGTGNAARFNNPSGVAVDSAGNVYVADTSNDKIRKVTPAGVVTTLAGSGQQGSVDGTGITAQFLLPSDVAVDKAGNLFVAERHNHIIRRVTEAGVVTTLAGLAGYSGTGDGTGNAARFNNPSGVAVDSTGNVYVADTSNYTIRKMTPGGVVTTLAGSPGQPGHTNGTGIMARFNGPTDVTVDDVGNILVADNGRLRKITSAGVVTTLPGTVGFGVVVDGAGDVISGYNYTVRKITPTGAVTTLAGALPQVGSADGVGSAARFWYPYGVAVDGAGNVFVADSSTSTIRKVTPAGMVTTLAGSPGQFGSTDGTGNVARFRGCWGVAIDITGNVFVADYQNHTIRKVTPAGVVTTLAGNPGQSGTADGAGSAARFSYPRDVAVDGAGNVFVADNNTIRKVTPAGMVTTPAGLAGYPGSGDGTGNAARFNYPSGVAVDSTGNVYVADTGNDKIRKVTPAGVVTTLAGNPGQSGSADGTGSSAQLFWPSSVAVDSAGNVYVADTDNHTIRKVSPQGVVTTIGGIARIATGVAGIGGAAKFSFPRGIAVDGAGNLYVVDANNRVSKGTPVYSQGNLGVTPVAPVPFGSIQASSTAKRTFTVSNFGNSVVSGSASVSPPFSIVTGGSYTLLPSQSQVVTVQYAPLATGNHTDYVTFSGGGGATRQVTGSAFNDPAPSTGTIAGRVRRSDTQATLNGIAITAVGPGANLFNGGASAGTVSGGQAGQAGSFSISGLAPSAHYHVLATAPGQEFYLAELTDVNVVAGQTTTVNIELLPVPGSSLPPTLTSEQTPVVLVRGTGRDTDWVAGESGYWAAMRAALVGQGFQRVWDCNQPDSDPDFPVNNGQGHVINGESTIWWNGVNLRYYVEQKAEQFNRDQGYYPPAVNIVAHSMGGLITRSAMIDGGFVFFSSNGKWVRTKVNKVVMLTTPNAGSALADIGISTGLNSDFFHQLTGWQPAWPATKDVTTHHVQATFNAAHAWPAGVKLYLLGGGGGLDSGSFTLRTGARALAGIPGALPPVNFLLPPEQVNDGAVTWPSVQGKFHKRSLPLMTLQQFTSVSLPAVVAPTFFTGLDHFEILDAPEVATTVISALRGTLPSSVLLSKGGVVTAAGGGIDPLPMQQFEQLSSTLFSGTTNEVAVISDAVTTLQFELLAAATNVSVRLKDPSGSMIDSTTPASNTNIHYSASIRDSNTLTVSYTINDPAAGTWKVTVDGATTTAPTVYELLVFGDSEVALIPQTGPLFNPGQDVIMNCALADLGNSPATPVQEATMTALVRLPDGSTTNFTLLDDGFTHDGAPNDGGYAAVLPNVQQPGDYRVSYRAVATNGQSLSLQRVTSGAFSVSSGRGALWGDPVYESIDTDADGLGDLLRVKCWVNPTVAGDYILFGELVNAAGTQRFAKSAQFASDGSGPMLVALIIDLAEIRATAGPGDFHIENLRLFEVKDTGAAWLDTYHGSSVVQLGPPRITLGFDGSYLHLSWPVDCLGWELQTHTNAFSLGLGTNWTTVPGSTNTTQMSIPIDPADPMRFYRLQYQ